MSVVNRLTVISPFMAQPLVYVHLLITLKGALIIYDMHNSLVRPIDIDQIPHCFTQ